MKSLVRWSKVVGTVVGAVIAVVTLMGMLNQALLDHLDQTFVTKDEFILETEKIDNKIDAILHRLESLPPPK